MRPYTLMTLTLKAFSSELTGTRLDSDLNAFSNTQHILGKVVICIVFVVFPNVL
jgi:hypothetical protein